MGTLKAFADGAGTASGAICPTFGLVTSHMVIGSTAALISGWIAAPLFFAVFGLFVYCSYDDYLNKKAEADAAELEKKQQFANIFVDYLITIVRKQLAAAPHVNLECNDERTSFTQNVKTEAFHILNNNTFPFPINISPDVVSGLIEEIIKNNTQKNPTLTLALPYKIKNECASRILSSINNTKQNNVKPISFKKKAWEFSKYFFPVLGSFSGGATGITGILYAMGLFSGFGTIPFLIIGGIVAASFVIAGVGGIIGCQFSSNLNEKKQLANRFELVNHAMKNTNKEWGETITNKLEAEQARIKAERKKQLVRVSSKGIKFNFTTGALSAFLSKNLFSCCRRAPRPFPSVTENEAKRKMRLS